MSSQAEKHKTKRPWRRSEVSLLAAPAIFLLLFFGWRSWQRQRLLSMGILGEHATKIGALAFAPDGTLASGSGGGWDTPQNPGEVKLWDVKNKALKMTVSESGLFSQEMSALAFSPDNKRLATGKIGVVSVWELPSRRRLWTMKGHGHGVGSLSFSPDSALLVSSSSDGMIKVWDAATGNLLWQRGPLWPGTGPDQNTHVAFAPGRSKRVAPTLASVGADGSLKLWHPRTGALQRKLRLEKRNRRTYHHTDVEFSSDGGTLATLSESGVTVWNTRAWHPRRKLSGNFYALALSPDGALLATRSSSINGDLMKLWSVATGKLLQTFEPLEPEREGGPLSNRYTGGYLSSDAVAFSPDGKTLAYIHVRAIRHKNIGALRQSFTTNGQEEQIKASQTLDR